MTFEIEDRHYEIIIASDVERDGLGCELWDIETKQQLMEIFRNDALKEVQFSSAEMQVPFEVIKKVLATFEERVGRDFQE